MMKRFILMVAGVMTCGLVASAAVAMPASAAFNPFGTCKPGDTSDICKAAGNDSAAAIVQRIVRVMLWLIAAISVIMIIVGGFKYVTANGDSNNIQSAKNTIMYSVAGLVVAIMGQAIVYFVILWFT